MSPGTIIHVCVSVRGLLSRDRRYLKKWLPYVTDADGKPYTTVDQLRDALMDELAKGNEVLPGSSSCVNFDPKKGCRGCPPKEAA